MWSTILRLISSGTRLIEAAIPGFHVKDGNFTALGGDRAETTIGISEYEDRFGV